ncbi:MAG: hypothetical protein J6J12_01600 [Oscillospiraceae bacterium]|nr:hypothetical protein [Oscillospiraceae bacterium]
MSNKLLYVLWGGLFILCAGLGFIPEPEGALRAGMTVLSLACFLPPAAVLYRSGKSGDRAAVKLVCCLAALSLGLTLVLLIGNVLSVVASETVGTALYYLLVIVSSPMVSSGYWALSLFLWACLLMAGWKLLRRK